MTDQPDVESNVTEPSLATSSSDRTEPEASSPPHTLLWSKSKVYVHPSPYAKHNIPGYLALSRAGTSKPGAKILLSFLPESLVEQRQELEKFVRIEYTTSARADDTDTRTEPLDIVEEEEDPESVLITEPPASSTYAFSLPLTSTYGFTVKKPTISSWYGTVTISQLGGVAMPTLHFHDDESKSTVLSMHRAKRSIANIDEGKLYPAPGSSGWSAGSYRNSRPTSPSPILGGDELVQQLRKYANVHRSAIDPNVFLINPSRADLELHSTPIFDDDAIDLPRPNAGNAAYSYDLAEHSYTMSPLHQSLPSDHSRKNELAMDNLTVWAKSARMSVLSSFANFTQQARHASHAVLSHPLARPYVPHLPGPVQSFAQAGPVPLGPNEGEWEWRTSSIANKSGTGEYYDSARVYLARWARLVAEEGERNRRKEERLGASAAAVEGLGSRPPSSAGARVEGSELGAFEILEKSYDIPRPTSEREARFSELKTDPTDTSSVAATGLSVDEWRSFFDPTTGLPLLPVSEIKHGIFVNGLTNEARKHAWPFLLDAVPFDATSEQRAALWQERELEYHTFKARWKTDEDLLATEEFGEQQHRVRVDCLRTDRNQPLFARDPAFVADTNADSMTDSNPHTLQLGEILLTYGLWESSQPTPASEAEAGLLAGYVQGMSDLCSPLYIMCEGDEAKTFWSFVGLMNRTKSNFYRDQSGMKAQLLLLQKLISIMDPALYAHLERTEALNLFFCFRWLLVRFKREFRFEETVGVWESCWAAEPSNPRDANSSPTSSSKSTSASKTETTPAQAKKVENDKPSAEERSEKANSPGWSLSKSFHLFCALALLELHKEYLMRYLENFDEILQYFNSLTGEFNAETVLWKAEVLAKGFKEIANHSAHEERKKEEKEGNLKGLLEILSKAELEMLL